MRMPAQASNGSGHEAQHVEGPARAPGRLLARALGGASVGLGLPQIADPDRVAQLVGVMPDARTRRWIRIVGVRELVAAGVLLPGMQPAGGLWSRVLGDAMVLRLLHGARLSLKPKRRRRIDQTIRAVAGIAALDLLAALWASVAQARAAASQTEGPTHVTAAITVWKPREEVYGFWHDFERLPRFMAHLESVQRSGDGRSHWKASAPAGTVEWDAELVDDRPNELIAWRSLPGAQIENAGVVRFRPAPGDWGTEVMLDLDYAPPGGVPGKAVAKLLGEEPQQQVEDDLRRFKQVMETGEIVRSEGSPEGTKAIRQAKQRPAQPLPAVGAGASNGGSAS